VQQRQCRRPSRREIDLTHLKSHVGRSGAGCTAGLGRPDESIGADPSGGSAGKRADRWRQL